MHQGKDHPDENTLTLICGVLYEWNLKPKRPWNEKIGVIHSMFEFDIGKHLKYDRKVWKSNVCMRAIWK